MATSRARLWMLVYLLLTLVLVLVGHYAFRSSRLGQDISDSMWGLNVHHYSKIFEKMSRNEGLEFESRLLDESTAGDAMRARLSHPNGLYPDGLSVNIHIPEGAAGFYSLDGSVPTRRDDRVDGPIEVGETTVLRVKAFADDTVGPTVTGHYVVSDMNDTAVASLVADPVYLFDRHAGIYANPQEKGRGWERPAQLALFDPASGKDVVLDVRVRVHGGASRGTSNYDRKSLRVVLLEQDEEFRDWLGPMAERVSPHQQEWVLRHVFNNRQLWADRIALRLAHELGLAAATARPIALHINGTRWGAYDLIERINAEFVEGKDGAGDVTLLHGAPLEFPLMTERAARDWNELYQFIIDADMADPGAFAVADSQIDLASLIDYYALAIFLADIDRPHNNIDLYRYARDANGEPGKWRFAVWDYDGGFNYRGLFTDHDTLAWHLRDALRPELKPVGTGDNPKMHSATRLFRHLMANAGFRDAFRRRLDALLETTFSSANVAATFDEVLEDYAELVPLELERFDPPSMWLLDGKVRLHRQEPDFSYDDRMQEIRRFIAERPAVVRRALDTHLPEGGES